MNPIVDHLLVIAVVLGALGFFAKRFFFKRSSKSCDAGCGCGSSQKKLKGSL
jgi:FeoB-associated Cys-rich membrane protein